MEKEISDFIIKFKGMSSDFYDMVDFYPVLETEEVEGYVNMNNDKILISRNSNFDLFYFYSKNNNSINYLALGDEEQFFSKNISDLVIEILINFFYENDEIDFKLFKKYCYELGYEVFEGLYNEFRKEEIANIIFNPESQQDLFNIFREKYNVKS